ncbi:MAG: FHA domain-containing protein, partial [Synergistaceae bacterium]|nr:FHA domain-containing protein [Synergistaceae bacterium]
MNYLLAAYVPGCIYESELSPGQSVTVGSGENDTLKIAGAALERAHLTVTAAACGVHALSLTPMFVRGDSAVNRMLAAWDVARISDTLSVAVFEIRAEAEDAVCLAGKDKIKIGRSAECDIRLNGLQVSSSHAVLRREADAWVLEDLDSANGTFVDGKLVKSALLKKNQVIFMGGWKFSIAGDMLTFLNAPEAVSVSPVLGRAARPGRLSEDTRYPGFQRSPRIKPEAAALETEVLSPPNRGSKPSVSWLSVLLPPMMMMAVMIGVSGLTRNRTTLFYTVPMSGVSIIMAIVNYKSQMKKWEGIQKLALEKYAGHLKEKDDEITAAETKYMLAGAAANPGPYECAAVAEERARRLWERASGDDDFLEVRLGTGCIPSNVKIKIPQAQLTLEDDPLLDEARKLREKHKELTGVPVVHSFFLSTVTGLSGDRDSVRQTARAVLMNVAAHHSYEDVKIVCVYPENEKREWAWVRWLPHVWNADRTERFVASSRAGAQELLKDAAETLRRRRFEGSAQDGAKRKFTPPFYFLMLADK